MPGFEDMFTGEFLSLKTKITPEEQQLLEMAGVRSVLDGGGLFCGVTQEAFAIGGVTYKWPATIRKLLWNVTFLKIGSISDMDFKEAATRWFQEIANSCNMLFEYTPDATKANILYTKKTLDGPSGVLADMQIPVGNLTPASQLLGRFDDSEAYVLSENPGVGAIDMYRTGAHETLHALGLGHQPTNVDPAQKALIAPMYSLTIKNLMNPDRSELVRRYGPAVVTPQPPTSPTVNPITLESIHTLRQGTRTWKSTTVTELKPV